LSERRDRDNVNPERDDATLKPARDEDSVKQTAGRISAAIGLLFALGGVISALGGGGASITAGAVGVALGILGYFLGSNRLGTIAVVFSIAALFFGLAASQGYIPGIDASDRDLPSRAIEAD
jgi:VIT1/CCC1 family predicted Fe2+/Mn2+ transporter